MRALTTSEVIRRGGAVIDSDDFEYVTLEDFESLKTQLAEYEEVLEFYADLSKIPMGMGNQIYLDYVKMAKQVINKYKYKT